MRLTPEQQHIVREEVSAIFGQEARVHLFGSRTDDKARGGDIDLYIEAHGTEEQLLDRELRLYARLQRRLGERRIDIVTHHPDRPLRPIDRHARATGVAL
jgi:predicted nucleotidyltransferase